MTVPEPDEHRILGGHARSLAEAEAWLREVGGALAVHPERIAPAMLSLSGMNAHFLATAATKPTTAVRKFLKLVESRCSDARYAAVQEKFLNAPALRHLSQRTAPDAECVSAEKYLYLPFWAAAKLNIAEHLGLRDRPPLAILDLGSGPGHFALACEQLGHTCWGLDIPFTPTTPFSKHDLYGELFEAFGLQRMIHRITPHEPLPVPRRFDLVTAQMATFCTRRDRGKVVAWGWSDWRSFLRNLVERVVAPRFTLQFGINRAYLPDDVVEGAVRIGGTFDASRYMIQFTDEHADAILAAPG